MTHQGPTKPIPVFPWSLVGRWWGIDHSTPEGCKVPTPEPLIRLLHAAYAAPADGVTDAELLARVAAGRDDAAFELLVRRYAELVWRVCRAVTRDHHAAEDAFQAAFLALATKAAAVRGDPGGWLYRVAYHAALKARRAGRPARAAVVSPGTARQPGPWPVKA